MADQTDDIEEIGGHRAGTSTCGTRRRTGHPEGRGGGRDGDLHLVCPDRRTPAWPAVQSWLYQMRYEDGGIPDVDYMEDEEDRSQSLGDGSPPTRWSTFPPATVVVQSSDASIYGRAHRGDHPAAARAVVAGELRPRRGTAGCGSQRHTH